MNDAEVAEMVKQLRAPTIEIQPREYPRVPLWSPSQDEMLRRRVRELRENAQSVVE